MFASDLAVLGFLEVYYTYKPFAFTGYLGIHDSGDLLAFLGTGYMAYTCFWSMVQNAWSMSLQEREDGTLEITFLTPASRMAMNYGKALGALIQEVWMFGCFCLFVLFYTHTLTLENLWALPLFLCLLLFSSMIWGGMLNAIFLYSRDASMIMDVFDAPMILFAGTRIPVQCFPVWAKVISLLFPPDILPEYHPLYSGHSGRRSRDPAGSGRACHLPGCDGGSDCLADQTGGKA